MHVNEKPFWASETDFWRSRSGDAHIPTQPTCTNVQWIMHKAPDPQHHCSTKNHITHILLSIFGMFVIFPFISSTTSKRPGFRSHSLKFPAPIDLLTVIQDGYFRPWTDLTLNARGYRGGHDHDRGPSCGSKRPKLEILRTWVSTSVNTGYIHINL